MKVDGEEGRFRGEYAGLAETPIAFRSRALQRVYYVPDFFSMIS